MYIRRNKKDENETKENVKKVPKLQKKIESGEREKLESPHDMLISKNSIDVILHWKAPEFEIYERDSKWYFTVTGILLAIIAYALFTNSLIMAITFILIGAVGYIYINKEPRFLDFMITRDGIVVGKEIYNFGNLKSFWIFYEEDLRVISFKNESFLDPYVHIPIPDEDPVKIREILLGYLPEEKNEPGFVEVLDRLLRL